MFSFIEHFLTRLNMYQYQNISW